MLPWCVRSIRQAYFALNWGFVLFEVGIKNGITAIIRYKER